MTLIRQDNGIGGELAFPHRLLLLNALDITAHGAAQGRVLLELQNYPGDKSRHKMLCLQLPAEVPLPDRIDQMPAKLRWLSFRAGLALWLLPHLLKRLRQVDAVVVYGVDLQVLILTLLAAKFTRTAIFNEITEHPHVIFASQKYKQIGNFVYDGLLLRRFSGMIVISTALERHVRGLAPSMPVYVMPPIAEAPVSPPTGDILPGLFTYAGSLSEPKDGVISLVRAFDTVHRQRPDARLHIFGHGSASQRAALDAEIVARGLAEVVQVYQSITRDALMAAMGESDVLVHCRPSSQQANYGFPTKLAEYLSTGRPVVTTITSDIAQFLKDRDSAYLVPPDDTQAFARAMLLTLSDRALAAVVGACGRQVFDTHFRAAPVVARLSAWIGARVGRQGGPI